MSIVSMANSLARRAAQAQPEYRSIPFEYRPVLRLRNIPVPQHRAGAANCFYVGPMGNSVALVYDDQIVEYEFDDLSALRTQVQKIESLEIHRVNVVDGLLKILASLAAFVVFLQFIVWLSS